MVTRRNKNFIITTFCIIVSTAIADNQPRLDICDDVATNVKEVQCYCSRDSRASNSIKSADCYLIKNGTTVIDTLWNDFKSLSPITKLTLTNPGGVPLYYIPTTAFKFLSNLHIIHIKYAEIEYIPFHAFTDLSSIQEIILTGNEVKTLAQHAFSNCPRLVAITLDQNKITEINREVFEELPVLEKLFLTHNQITTIHDRAFRHLANLKELELNKNKIFSLNSESFFGLTNLRKLELSSNSLEVIGDNTFAVLKNLQYLSLEDNNIQMIDDKAFSGLPSLRILSLARNKIAKIENENLFSDLMSLSSLNLKSNDMTLLKYEVMKPIIQNFQSNSSNFEFEDNEFPCSCSLEWFLMLTKNTQNSRIKLYVENLKCNPDKALSEKWKKLEETDKSSGATFDESLSPQNGAEYEYYDETQLEGKLFYVDVRDLLNCSNATEENKARPPSQPNREIIKPSTDTTINDFTSPSTYTSSVKNTLSSMPTSFSSETTRGQGSSEISVPFTDNSITKSTPKDTSTDNRSTEKFLDDQDEDNANILRDDDNDLSNEKPHIGKHFPVSREMIKYGDGLKSTVTTSRLATVSAKPTDDKHMDNDKYNSMASDEAAPPNAHHQIQRNFDKPVAVSLACKNYSYTNVIFMLLTFFILDYFN